MHLGGKDDIAALYRAAIAAIAAAPR
jgi:hypothetical protein